MLTAIIVFAVIGAVFSLVVAVATLLVLLNDVMDYFMKTRGGAEAFFEFLNWRKKQK